MNRQHLTILILGILFIFGLSINVFRTSESNFEDACSNAELNISQSQDEFNLFSSNYILLEKIINNKLSIQELETLNDKNSYLYIYKGAELIYWNKNSTIPETHIDNIKETGSLLLQKNGYYFGLKKQYGSYTIVGMQLIKTNYSIVNAYLKNQFAYPYTFTQAIKIEGPDYEIGQPIKNQHGRTIFKAVYNNYNSQEARTGALILSFATLLIFLILIWQVVQLVRKTYGLRLSYVTLIVLCFIFIEVVLLFDFEFKKTILFSPELFASHYYGNSLGHLFLFSFTIFLTGSYAAYYFYYKKWNLKNRMLCGLYLLLILFLTVSYNAVVKSLILDSVISFEINNFTLMNIYTFFGLFIIIFLTFSLILYLYIWIYSAYQYLGKKAYIMIFVFFLLTSIILYFLDFKIATFISSIILAILLTIHLYLLRNRQFYNRFNYLLSLLFFTSLLISSLLNYYNVQNEDLRKINIANQLSEKRDLITEYRFEQIQEEIKADPFFKKFFISPFVSQKELQQRLSYLYFGGYLSKYNVSSSAFNIEGKAIKTTDTTTLNTYYSLLNKNSEETFSDWLFLIPQSDGNNNYLSILPIENNGVVSGTLVLELSPKKYHKENLYPELLIEEKTNPIAKYRSQKDYEYAIYKNNYLISQTGEFPFPYLFDVFGTSEEVFPYVLNTKGSRLNFFEVDSETKVVFSSPGISALIPISTFSYVFFLIGFLAFISYLIILFVNYQSAFLPIEQIRFTFKNKINMAITSITVASFIVVGIVTVGYFSELYRANNTEKLIKKQKSVLSSLEYFLHKNKVENHTLPSNLNTEIASLAEIHGIDINLFGLNGNLIVSSQPGVFGIGLISKKINPLAINSLLYLSSERHIQDEEIGSLSYQSVYVPLRSTTGEAVAILNLPYFAQEKTLRTELSNLMVNIVNIYALLLFLSIIVAFLISRSITSPLANISNKLSLVNLDSKNETIDWSSDDEIGALVTEYNKMIKQIEESANALAQSERESAWREMARQIAHEIKNPLTPMKLGIQHLQRTIAEDPEKVPALAERVSKTMIEQIENLAEIATAFSSFAKMPQANKEVMNLMEVLNNVVDLFNKTKNASVVFETDKTEAVIFADKNQLLSVFNNLVQNAIQACVEIENPEIFVNIKSENEYFIVSVQDNGIGISKDKHNKVFVPNFTTKSSGTGLGLAISKQIIENSLGRIWFESEENKGTTFYVSIPEHQEN